VDSPKAKTDEVERRTTTNPQNTSLPHQIHYSLFISEAQLSGFIIHYSFLVPSHPASQEVTRNE